MLTSAKNKNRTAVRSCCTGHPLRWMGYSGNVPAQEHAAGAIAGVASRGGCRRGADVARGGSPCHPPVSRDPAALARRVSSHAAGDGPVEIARRRPSLQDRGRRDGCTRAEHAFPRVSLRRAIGTPSRISPRCTRLVTAAVRLPDPQSSRECATESSRESSPLRLHDFLIVHALKEDHVALRDDGSAEPLTHLFAPHNRRPRGRPFLRERRPAIDAVAARAKKLRPVLCGDRRAKPERKHCAAEYESTHCWAV